MRRAFFLPILLLKLAQPCAAQSWFGRHLPHSSATVQYAGSIGLVAMGYERSSPAEHFSFGLHYGYLPPNKGGTIHTLSFKLGYAPWRCTLGHGISWQPLRVGAFVVLAVGEGLHVSRPPQFEHGYYWWTENFRQHLSLGTELAVNLSSSTFSRMGVWLEANTNDLYLYSWWPNQQAIPFWDIVKLGIGARLYFAGRDADRAIPR